MKKFWSVATKNEDNELEIVGKELKDGTWATRFTSRDIAIALASQLAEEDLKTYFVLAASRIITLEEQEVTETKMVAQVSKIEA